MVDLTLGNNSIAWSEMHRYVPIKWLKQLPSSITTLGLQCDVSEVNLRHLASFSRLTELHINSILSDSVVRTRIKDGEYLSLWAMRLHTLMENIPTLNTICYETFDRILSLTMSDGAITTNIHGYQQSALHVTMEDRVVWRTVYIRG